MCKCGHPQLKHYKLTGACDAQDPITGRSCECSEYVDAEKVKNKSTEPKSPENTNTEQPE